MDDAETTSLLAASLEAFLHQLVFAMNVYPSDSFTKSTFLGIVGQTNRHSGVVDYISQCIHVAVPVLLGGSGSQMIVIVGKERFVLTIRLMQSSRLMESRLRDLILSVHAMERRKEKHDSFQIQLLPVTDDCPELIRGMSDGQWYQVNNQACTQEGRRIRPIHDIQSGDCEISFFAQRSSSSESTSSYASAS
jgi:hypothetical protein